MSEYLRGDTRARISFKGAVWEHWDGEKWVAGVPAQPVTPVVLKPGDLDPDDPRNDLEPD